MRASFIRGAGWLAIAVIAFLALYVWEFKPVTYVAIIAGVVTCLFGFPFVLLPIRFHRCYIINLQSKHEPIHPGCDILPQDFWDCVTQTVGELDPLGFRVRGHFRGSDDATGTVAYVSLFENAAQLDVATLAVVFVPIKLASRMHSTVGIISKFVDGTEVVTANNRILSHFASPKNWLILWLPNIRNAGTLYRSHRKAIQRLKLGEKRPTLDGDPVEFMNQARKTEVARWVKLGYYRPDESGDVLWITWKGAALSAWSHLWPGRDVRRAWRRHQTNKLLRKLEE